MYSRFPALWPAGFLFLFSVLFLLSGCSGSSEDSRAPGTDMEAEVLEGAGEDAALRPNTPVIYEPLAPLSSTLGEEPLIVDISNTDQGYVMARYSGSAARANIQITGPDGIHYKYFLAPSDTYTPLPLTSGDGAYQIDGFENISGTQYAVLFRENIDVHLENELLPFLYPNQYVYFDAESEIVPAAAQAAAGASSDLDAVADIYHFVIEHVTYDTEKAETVEAGYLPDVDETLRTGRGICFDYASLTAAMLRSQNIPARLEIGYSGDIYHAWISVYTEETGWIDQLIEFTGEGWTRMDPTLAAGNGNSKAALKYIGDGSNYTTQYIR